MCGPRGENHSGIVQAKPQQRLRVDGAGQPGPGRPRDVEPPAAGEGQAVPGTGAHRVRGEAFEERRGERQKRWSGDVLCFRHLSIDKVT